MTSKIADKYDLNGKSKKKSLSETNGKFSFLKNTHSKVVLQIPNYDSFKEVTGYEMKTEQTRAEAIAFLQRANFTLR